MNFFKKPDLEVRHQWKLLSKMYASPVNNFNGPYGQISDKALLGVTTLVWECQLTGDVRTKEVLGSDESQLEEICDKVLKQGPQNFKNAEGRVFAVGLYVPPVVTNPLDLPLK